MPVIVAGLNHKTAPVGLLERLAIPEEDLPKALHQLDASDHVLESAVLSTCNRIEVYAVVSRFHAGSLDVRNFLAEFRHVPPEDFIDHLYGYHDEAAVRHLFRVAAGVDSMVVGESEILGQVRRAYSLGVDHGAVRRVLGAAFRRALHVGKRARAETAIGRNPASVSTAAVELARRALGSDGLGDKRVTIVGAGKMGVLAARALAGSGVRAVTIVNRSPERASEVAHRLNASVRPFEELADALADADIVLSSTTAPGSIIGLDLMATALARRHAHRPLFVVDIAVPRDVDPAVGGLPGVILRDIDDLREVVETTLGSRLAELSRVEDIIGEELERFSRWERSSELGPTLGRFRELVESARRREVEKAIRGGGAVSQREREAIERATRRVVGRLLHDPVEKAKGLASSKQAHLYLSALRELFALDEEPPD